MSGERKPVVGLRGPREEVAGLVYFGRMVDKVRLERAGKLPEEYRANLGQAFDRACCDFLGVDYEKLRGRVGEGGTDEEILHWCEGRVEGGMRGSGKFGASIYRKGVGGTRWRIG